MSAPDVAKLFRVLITHAPVDLNQKLGPKLLALFGGRLDFVNAGGDEGLASKAWVDAHDKKKVNLLEDVVRYHVKGGAGVERYAAAWVEVFNLRDHAVVMIAGLPMKSQVMQP